MSEMMDKMNAEELNEVTGGVGRQEIIVLMDIWVRG
jgi:bacteriocin-like protein